MFILSITSGIITVSDNESIVIVLLDAEEFGVVYGLLEGLGSLRWSSLLGVAVGPGWKARRRESAWGGSRILLDIRQVCKHVNITTM